jgi:diacylglycerol kinase (ATP)
MERSNMAQTDRPADGQTIERVRVIVNPAAGQPGEPILNVLYRVFRDADIDWNVAVTHGARDGVRLAEAALAEDPDAVVVYGGDGTVRKVAGVLMKTDVPLAILPGGTANLFAVQMGIPRAIRRAARLIAGPHAVAPVDVGVVGDEAFVVAAGTGLIADTMEEADRDMKERIGYAAYLLSGVRRLRDLRPAAYRIELDGGEVREGNGIACLVSNTNSIGISGVGVPAGGSNRDGLLDVILFHDIDPQTVLSVAANAVGMEELAAPLPRWTSARVRLEADPPQLITCDGDIIGETPATIELHPGALKVITPPARPG